MNKRSITLKLGLGMLTMLLGTFSVAAAQDDLDMIVLDSVVVTASGYEQNIAEAPASITVISREEIEKSTATNLIDVLKGVESVNVITSTSSNEKDISIRGMSGEYTLIMVDGKRQNTRETMNRGTMGVMSSFIPPLESIERIEIVRGPMSSLYGADAMGGVINIITRKVPKKWSGTASIGTVLPEDSKEGDQYNGSFWLSGPLMTDHVGIMVYGNITDKDEEEKHYVKPSTNGAGEKTEQTLGTKLAVSPSKAHDFVFDISQNELTYETTAGKSISPTSNSTKVEHERLSWSAGHDGRWNFGTSNIVLYQEIAKKNEWSNGVKAITDQELTNTTLDAKFTVPLRQHIVKVGGQLMKAELKGIKNEASVANYPGVNPDKVTVDSYALFIEDEFAVTEKIILTGGVRLDDDERFGSYISPRLYGIYKATDTITFRAGVAKGFKAPTIRQSAANYCMTTGGSVGQGILCGNPDLDVEESITTELGVRYDAPSGTSLSLVVFNTDFKNKVMSYGTADIEPNTGRNVYVYDNIDEVTIRGAELSAKVPVTKTIVFNGNYVYTDSQREGGGETAFNGASLDGKPFERTPEHAFNLKLDWQPLTSLSLFAGANYASEIYYAGYRNGANHTRKRGSYTTFDLGGSYSINDYAAVNFAVLNVTDKKLAIDDRTRAEGLDGNWIIDEGLRVAMDLKVKF